MITPLLQRVAKCTKKVTMFPSPPKRIEFMIAEHNTDLKTSEA